MAGIGAPGSSSRHVLCLLCVVVLLINLMPPSATGPFSPTLPVARVADANVDLALNALNEELSMPLAGECLPCSGCLVSFFRSVLIDLAHQPLRLFCPSWGQCSPTITRMPLHLA